MYDIRLDRQIIMDKIRRVGIVCMDAADPGCRQNNVFRLVFLKKRFDVGLPPQIEIAAPARD
jgi:hypothetical protein